MPSLPVKLFQQFVDGMVASWATSIGISPSLPAGDPLLATFESVSGQLLFVQGLIQLVNAVARAQTSEGPDVDSFIGQYGFPRLGGTAATGPVSFSSLIPVAAPTPIPAAVPNNTGGYSGGATITTAGGAVTYRVVPDANNPSYDPASNAYLLPAGATTVSATAQATIVGTSGNVAAGTLITLATSIPGIDGVTNPGSIANGIDAETDSAVLARFVLWLNSLSKAIEPAIAAAIESVQPGLIYVIVEQRSFYAQTLPFADDNTWLDLPGPVGPATEHFSPGNFFIVIDDGSGSPPLSLITNVFNAVDKVRGFTISFQVYAPVDVTANVALALVTPTGVNHANAVGAVGTALASYVNGLSLTTMRLALSDLVGVARAAAPAGTTVPLASVTINGIAQDLTLSAIQVPRIGLVEVQ